MSGYDAHPYVRWRREQMPDLPFAIIDGLALANWMESNPDATPDEFAEAMLSPEYVLWASHPLDGLEVAMIIQVEHESGGEVLRVVELREVVEP